MLVSTRHSGPHNPKHTAYFLTQIRAERVIRALRITTPYEPGIWKTNFLYRRRMRGPSTGAGPEREERDRPGRIHRRLADEHHR